MGRLRHFLGEYGMWTVAPFPFLLPYLVLKSYMHGDSPVSFHSFTAPLFAPGDWCDDSFTERLLENLILWSTSYLTAWVVFHLARYTRAAGWKFNAKVPPASMVLTEMLRSIGGIVVLTLLQTQVLAPRYTAHRAADSRPTPVRDQLTGLVVLALWADLHFYVTHRMMHEIKPLYKWVHKVHHKSINTDPWSGLSMHPVEHIVYFSAAALVLVVPGGAARVPFWLTNLLCVSLVVYPIPAHIGYWPFERHHWEHRE